MGLTSRRYSIYKIAGRKVTNELKRPGVAQDGQAPVWNNALKKYEPGVVGGGSSTQVIEAIINVIGTVDLDFNNFSDVIFFSENDVTVLSFWNLLNAAQGKRFSFPFYIDTLDPQTFPDDWLVSTLTGEWDGDAWTAGNVGKYLMEGVYDGTFWHVKISGNQYNMKKIFALLFSLTTIIAFGQSPIDTRLIRMKPILAANAADTAQTLSNQGKVWYDFVTKRWRYNENGLNRFFNDNGTGSFLPRSGTSSILNDLIISYDNYPVSWNGFGGNSSYEILGGDLNVSTFKMGNNLYTTTSVGAVELFSISESNNLNYVTGVKGNGTSFRFGAFNTTTPDNDQLYIEATTNASDNNTLRIVDNRTVKLGLQYAGDYFGGYNDRTLPDFGSVKNGGYTFTNKTLSTGTVFSANPTINSGVKFSFVPTTTIAGLNVGSFTTDPTTLVNGDLWYNSTTNKYIGRRSAVTDEFVQEDLVQTLTNKTLSTSTTISSSPTISDGVKITFNPNNTSAGLNIGANSTDPTTLVNSDLWYNSTQNRTFIRENGVTNKVATVSSSGVLNIGEGFSPTSNIINASGSGANIPLVINSKGSATIALGSSTGIDNLNFNFTANPISIISNTSGISINSAQQLTLQPTTFLILVNIPSNCTGAPSGAVYNDSGTLKICP
jgi:hypothetical protein